MKRAICLAMCLSAGATYAATIQFDSSNSVTNPDFSTTFDAFSATEYVAAPQSFDGFTFNQVNSASRIWTRYNPGGSGDGRSWYPDGGDFGYTEISLTSGENFGDVSLHVGTGNATNDYLAYELLDDNVVIQSGGLSGHTTQLWSYHWLTISGGGFDTIRLRDSAEIGVDVGSGGKNALAFDSVYVTTSAVPLPSSLALFAASGAFLFGFRRLGKRGNEAV